MAKNTLLQKRQNIYVKTLKNQNRENLFLKFLSTYKKHMF